MTCFAKKVLSLGRESKRSSKTSYACERGLSHELINFEPSPQVARGKIRSVGNMKGNSFTDNVYSLFTTHHSLINNDIVFSLLTQSYFLFHTRHMNIITNIVIFCHRIIYIFLEYFFSTTDLQIFQYRIIEFIR